MRPTFPQSFRALPLSSLTVVLSALALLTPVAAAENDPPVTAIVRENVEMPAVGEIASIEASVEVTGVLGYELDGTSVLSYTCQVDGRATGAISNRSLQVNGRASGKVPVSQTLPVDTSVTCEAQAATEDVSQRLNLTVQVTINQLGMPESVVVRTVETI